MSSGGDINKELMCLVALRDARSSFFRDLIAHATQHLSETTGVESKLSKDDFDIIRSESTYQIAEFYYLADEFRLADRRRIRAFLNRHNSDMDELLQDKNKRETMKLISQRIEEAKFKDFQIERVVENIIDNKLRLDQTDIGRLLSPLMSPETCRKALISLSKGGLINRINVGQALIISNGNLEKYFKKHLSQIAEALVGSQPQGANT